jgi:hypothetical protein
MQITGRWFSPEPPVSSTNKTDRHDTTEILLKVALTTITLTPIHALSVHHRLTVSDYPFGIRKLR